MQGLIVSLIHRPYVFAFLAAYLFLAWKRWGWPRALLWLVSGYLIAWISEYSSIHNGFPYGEYHYIYENLRGELLVAGVPFFDSLSYVFLTFAGYTTAEFVLVRWCDGAMVRWEIQKSFSIALSPYRPIAQVVFGAFLTMLLDVIIDPIATMGDKWFLGQIHFYAHPGFYFGVPMTNFGGWFLVSFAVIAFNAIAWHAFPRFFESRVTSHESRTWLHPSFYTGIALFSICISFWVGEWKLGIVSGTILAVLVSIALSSARMRSH